MRLSTTKKRIIIALLVLGMIFSCGMVEGLNHVSAEETQEVASAGDASMPSAAKDGYTDISGSSAAADDADAADLDSDKTAPEDAESEEDLAEDEEVVLPSELGVNFAVIEDGRFDTPATDKYLVIDLGEGGNAFENAQVVLLNETTAMETVVDADTINDTSMLFYLDFPDDSYAGRYLVESVRYEIDGVKYEKLLSDDEMTPRFGVNVDIDQEPDGYMVEEDEAAASETEEYDPELESQIIDMSGDFDNATVLGIEGDENSKVDLSGDDSAKNDSNSDYASLDKDSQKIVDSTVDGITKSINENSLLSVTGNTLVFSKAPANVVVVLDPGHGGSDSGAVGNFGGKQYVERDINQKIANACKAELEKVSGITVYLTRGSASESLHGSVGNDLQWRCDYAHSVGADLFVSLHCNAAVTPNSRYGAEVYVPNSSYSSQAYNVGKTVGTTIGKKLAALGIANGATYTRSSENGTKYSDGTIADYYAVIRGCKEYGIPAMIVEHAYVNHQGDCEKYFSSDDKIYALGKADAQGIAENLGLLQQNRVDGNVVNKGWKKSGSSWIYYNDLGNLCTGFFAVNGFSYYAKSNGEIVTGWQLINGNYYYFASDGKMYRNLWTKNSSGKWLYLKSDGKMATGVNNISGQTYLFNSDGIMMTGWQKWGGDWYCMNDSGAMLKNVWTKSSSGYWYYLKGDGKMATGTVGIKGTYYCFYGSGEMATGWIKSGNNWYYATSSGALAVNCWQKVNGYWYYFGDKGVMKTGWLTTSGQKFFLWGSGAMLTGWMQQGSNWYYADDSGYIAKNCWQKIKGYWYYFDGDGKMCTGVTKVKNKYYLMASSGEMQTGWTKWGSDWYYGNADGDLVAGNWLKSDGKWYYFDDDAKMATNLRIIGNKTYYFYKSGDLAYSVTNQTSQTGQNVNTNSNGEVTNTKLHSVMGGSSHSVTDLVYRYKREGKSYPTTAMAAGGAPDINTFCKIVVEEANAEGVNSDLVFAQIMHETGWLQFGGDVKANQYNFCGLGATGGGNPGYSFENVRTGIRAQVQHLKAYGSKDALKQACVDPRFKYVERGCAQYIEYLGQQENPQHKGWATNKNYGTYLMNIIYSIP